MMSKKPYVTFSLVTGIVLISAALLIFLLAPTITLVLEGTLLFSGILNIAMGAIISKHSR